MSDTEINNTGSDNTGSNDTKEIEGILNDVLDNDIPIYHSKRRHKKDILVISGGSIKGLALAGVFKAFELRGYYDNFTTVIGTSVGSLFSTFYVLGYTGDDMVNFTRKFNWKLCTDINPTHFMTKFGIETGNKIVYTVKELIKAKGYDENTTFMDVYKKTGKELIIPIVRVRPHKTYFLSYKTTPDMEVWKAIRISISVPIVFLPVLINGEYFVDGGLPEVFPVTPVKNCKDRVIGVCLRTKQATGPIKNIMMFIMDIMHCLLEGMKDLAMREFHESTINIYLDDNEVFNLDIPQDKIDGMINVGFIETIKYLDQLEETDYGNEKNINEKEKEDYTVLHED